MHSSLALHKDMEARPLNLEKCLDTFTAQEDIKEVQFTQRREAWKGHEYKRAVGELHPPPPGSPPPPAVLPTYCLDGETAMKQWGARGSGDARK